MTEHPGAMRRWLPWLWVAGMVQIAGRGMDLRWHATHPGFVSAGNGPEIVHVLLVVAWAGVLAGIVDVTVRTLRQRTRTVAEVEA